MAYKDLHIINLLKNRDGIETKVVLNNGSVLSIWNIAWGYDIGDEFAHITTNISPFINNTSIDFFYSPEIEKILTNENQEIIVDNK